MWLRGRSWALHEDTLCLFIRKKERKKTKRIRKMGWEREERKGAKEPPRPLANTWVQLSVLIQVM